MGNTGWAKEAYNEKRPFGRGATIVGGDNIEFSRERRQAIIAVKANRATPEQRALVEDADRIIQECLEGPEEK